MKKVKSLIISFLIIVLAGGCFPGKHITKPANVITKLSDTVTIRDGSLVYALPMTVFTIKVEVEKRVEIPGPYARYSEDLLGLKDVIMTGSERWAIKDIAVDSHEEVDPSEFYVIQSTGLFPSNVLALKKEGLILDLNPEKDPEGISFITDKEISINQFRSYDLGSDEYYQLQTDTAYRRLRVDSTFIRLPYIVEKKKKLTQDQLAETAAKRLIDLRDGKILILTGEATVFPQSNAPIDEINRMEKSYTELFTGKIFSELRTFKYLIIPDKDKVNKPETLFWFSTENGPLVTAVAGSTPVTIQLSPAQKTKDLTLISKERTDQSSAGPDKIFYRIPDVADINISLKGKRLYASRKLVYQFGEVLQLPANYIIGK